MASDLGTSNDVLSSASFSSMCLNKSVINGAKIICPMCEEEIPLAEAVSHRVGAQLTAGAADSEGHPTHRHDVWQHPRHSETQHTVSNRTITLARGRRIISG